MSEPTRPATGTGGPTERRLGLGELTREAGVSVRTVRYYIAEGLLPPPAGAGPASHYTAVHLDRLRLIARLKAAYLPLKEIRRRLVGLDDAEVRRLLAEEDARGAAPAPDRAAAYIDRVLGARSVPSPAPPAAPSTRPRLEVWGMQERASPDPGEGSTSGTAPLAAMANDPVPPPVPGYPTPAPMLGRAYPAAFSLPEEQPATEAAGPRSEAWRRVSLGDDAELLIRESAYDRRRDRIDWLIGWARKVFG